MFKHITTFFTRTRARLTAEQIVASKLTYLSAEKLRVLEKYARQVQDQNVQGAFIEYGVALGGSAIFIVSLMNKDRSFVGFDLFGTIPPPGPNDDQKSHDRFEIIKSGASIGIGGDQYYGYVDDLRNKVGENFKDYGFPIDGKKRQLVRGLFEDTIRFPSGTKIAFAHIDCDWYDPVSLCLSKTAQFLQPGGIIILDDYNDYGGCKRATDEFLISHPQFRLLESQHNAAIIRS